MRPRSREALAWAAGLFEGEGCITQATSPVGDKYPQLSLGMTDRDSVERFHAAVGIGAPPKREARPEGWKTMWRWRLSGFESVQAVLAMLWFGLGSRRRTRAEEVLRAAPRPRRRTHCKHGHPLRGRNLRLAPSGRTTKDGRRTVWQKCRKCEYDASIRSWRRRQARASEHLTSRSPDA